MSKPFAEIATTENLKQKFFDIYENETETEYAINGIQQINKDLEKREQASIVTNGISYSKAYEYNIKKSVNYSAPRNSEDDREISMGVVHEKVVAFVALFLKYAFKRRIKCYSNDMQLIDGMGTFYDLAIEFSLRQEQFVKKIALIIWEVFVQGNAFVYEDWEVKNDKEVKAFDKDEKEVGDNNMDYTFEYLDTLTFKDGDMKQTRRAVSRRLDGRSVIFGNPEIEEVQEQPRITLEYKYSKTDAEAIFGSLKRWNKVPTMRDDINILTGEALTLFNVSRLKDPKDEYLIHYVFDKENNRYNIYCNGILLFNSKTPMSIFYPRMNYPLSNIPCERLAGSIYARSTPAKTKFNADYLDWAFKMMAMRFEQGMTPAILAKGKYTLSKKIFKAGQVTHGVSKDDYEKADPENKGITQSEFSFVEMLKTIVETQTLGATATGEISPNATATEVNQVQSAQMEKLGFLLDGLMGGFMDMYLRRAETIESKYTIKQRETIVDGKTIGVYQNFSIGMGGLNHSVTFDEQVGSPLYDVAGKRAELFKKSFDEKKNGKPSEYHLVNPQVIRERNHIIDIEIIPEKIRDTGLQVQQLLAEFQGIKSVFANVDDKELQKEYLEVSGRPDSLFLPEQMMKEMEAQGQTPQVEQTKTGNMPSLMNKTVR